MNEEFQEIIKRKNVEFSRLFPEESQKALVYNNSKVQKEFEKDNPVFSHAFAIRGARYLEIGFKNKEEMIEAFTKPATFFAKTIEKSKEEMKESLLNNKVEEKRNEFDNLIKNKLNALYEVKDNLNFKIEDIGKNFSERQKQLFAEFEIGHEMTHIYFPNKNNPTYNKIFNNISLDGTDIKNSVGSMRDEIRADVISILLLKKKYGENDQDLNFVLKQISDTRMLTSLPSILQNSSQYNFYEVYKDNMSFIKSLPEISKENLAKIDKSIDDLTLKTLKEFGVQFISFLNKTNKNDFFEENIKQTNESKTLFCDNFKDILNKHYDIEIKDKNCKQDQEVYLSDDDNFKLSSLSKKDRNIIKDIPVSDGFNFGMVDFQKKLAEQQAYEASLKEDENIKTIEQSINYQTKP